jgi:hypothetical protein
MTEKEMMRINTELGKLTAPIQRLHDRIDELERWIAQEGERSDICTYYILKKKTPCVGCRCKRFVEIEK